MQSEATFILQKGVGENNDIAIDHLVLFAASLVYVVAAALIKVIG